MNITIEISEPLLLKVLKVAARTGVTFEAVVERGLRKVLAEAEPAKPFKLRDARVKGHGLQPGAQKFWRADRDFGRFVDVSVVNPLIGEG